jgi:ubiquinol-cytochrome c reductase cytochrome c subunit
MSATPGPAEARVLSRILRWGLLLAFCLQFWSAVRPAASQTLTDQQSLGRDLYTANCSTCHGVGLTGTGNGPSLQGVGPAAVDFMVSTGRMPIGDPLQQPVRQEPKFTQAQIDAIVAYVSTAAPGGPAIPTVDLAEGNLPEGFRLFSGICSSCHGAGATGDSVGGGQIAPALGSATPKQVAEAVRVGPGTMPAFGEGNLSDAQLDSIIRYVDFLKVSPNPGGLGIDRLGPVAEGFIAIVVGLGLLLLTIYLTVTKA